MPAQAKGLFRQQRGPNEMWHFRRQGFFIGSGVVETCASFPSAVAGTADGGLGGGTDSVEMASGRARRPGSLMPSAKLEHDAHMLGLRDSAFAALGHRFAATNANPETHANATATPHPPCPAFYLFVNASEVPSSGPNNRR